jgi:neutral ceramidase
VVVALGVAVAGCAIFQPKSRIKGEIPTRASDYNDPASDTFRVGAARVDITPIPGIAMNYSLNGKVSRGFWTRLYARAIYLQDKSDQAVVLVSCDLPHIPNGLSDRVAVLVSEKTAPAVDHLGREQIVLSATHSHNSAENYFSSVLYNSFPSPRSGFDPQLFDFLAERIATAIQRAFAARRDATLHYRRAKLDLFFRNRAFEAFLRDADSAAFLAENAAISTTCRLAEGGTDGRACRAVRTQVEVLEFRDTNAAKQPIATGVFLAAHPTVLSSATEVFSGDLFGVTASLLEQRRLADCAAYDPGVVAFFNGAQGDVSVTWERRDRHELLNTDAATGRIGLAVQLSEFLCGHEPGIDPVTENHPEPAIAWRFDRLGMGGAQDGRTLWFELGLKQGLRAAGRGEHGRKAIGLEMGGNPIPISEWLVKPDTVPKQVPVGSYRIGSIVIAALPGEFTSVMGERIRRALGNAAITPGDAPGSTAKERVLLIGLAGGHVSYVTTPEEYDAQFYSGAQNFYGAATGPLIQTKLVALTGESNGDTQSTLLGPYNYDYEAGVCRVFLPRDAGLPTFHADDGLQNILMDLAQPDVTVRDFPQQCWVDAIPKLSEFPGRCARPVPYVWIEPVNTLNPTQQCTQMFDPGASEFRARPCELRHPDECGSGDPRLCVAGVPQDNCGIDLVTILNGAYMDRTRWCAFWMPPASTLSPEEYRICVVGVTDENVVQMDAVFDESRRDELLATPLDRGAEAGWLLRTIASHRECCGDSIRPVCEWPLPPPGP